MTKQEAIKAAKEKADLSKRNQVVFSYELRQILHAGLPDSKSSIAGSSTVYDYTHESLWTRRQHRVPIVTKVTVVKPDILGLRK